MGVQLNEDRFGVVQVAFTPAEVAAGAIVEQTVSLPGALANDVFLASVIPPPADAKIDVKRIRVVSAGLLGLTYSNASDGALTPGAGTHVFLWFRPEHITVGGI